MGTNLKSRTIFQNLIFLIGEQILKNMNNFWKWEQILKPRTIWITQTIFKITNRFWIRTNFEMEKNSESPRQSWNTTKFWYVNKNFKIRTFFEFVNQFINRNIFRNPVKSSNKFEQKHFEYFLKFQNNFFKCKLFWIYGQFFKTKLFF